MTPTLARGAEAYYQTHVQSRSPLELVVMLYDGALRFLDQAAEAMDEGDMVTKATAMSRAFAILAELQNTLNVSEGGELARQLDALYGYMNDRLVDANTQRSSGPIRDVIRLLQPLRDAWSQAATPAAGQSLSA
jgi:flagellar protein FliS